MGGHRLVGVGIPLPWPTHCDVLIVDDEPAIRSGLSELLEDEGYVVATAENGRQALDFMNRRPPGMVLLDLCMPTLSGWDVLRELRHHPSLGAVPVLVMTASLHDLDLVDRPLIRKPLDIPKLLWEIRALLSRGEAVAVAR